MEGVIGLALAAVLKERRADFNQRFQLAQQQYRALAAEDWLAFVRDTLNPVAEIIAAHDESAVSAVIDALYDQALPLVAQRWLGPQSREPVLADCYKQLLVAFAPALTRDPRRVSAALLNALYQLCRINAARARDWTQRLTHIAPIAARSADVDALLAILGKNKRKLTVDPVKRAFQTAVAAEYTASLEKLLPIKQQLAATDQLIDHR